MAITCPGGKATLTSDKTETCHGIFTESTLQCAQSEAEQAVLNDLKTKLDQAECEGGNRCIKKKIDETQMATSVDYHRLWWTLGIVVECEANSTQSITIECVEV
jgi:hypothetical protein